MREAHRGQSGMGRRLPVGTKKQQKKKARRAADAAIAQIEQHRRKLSASGELAEKRSNQQVEWMWSTVDDRLLTALRGHSAVRSLLPALEADVRDGRLTPTLAADRILDAFED